MLHHYMIRPAEPSDINSVLSLAYLAQAGLTSLPKNKILLEKMILDSEDSFNKKVDVPGNELYLFVCEEVRTKKVVGICSIAASVGIESPFYAFKIETVKKRSHLINKEKNIKILKLSIERNGPSLIGTLFLNPDFREKGLGRFLSLSRFLFIEHHKKRFKKKVMAEMRGMSDKNGFSPFWHHVGRHFFDLEYTEADMLSAQDKSFIAEMIPRHPIYIPLLADEAQHVIGKTHVNTSRALNILESEGFKLEKSIDIFDGGPKVIANTTAIRSIAEAKKVTINNYSSKKMPLGFFAQGQLKSFRAYCGPAQKIDSENLMISHLFKNISTLKRNNVTFAPLYPTTNKKEETYEIY